MSATPVTAPAVGPLSDGDWVQIASCSNAPSSGDNEIQVVICGDSACNTAPSPSASNWSISLYGLQVLTGGYNMWTVDQSDYFLSGPRASDDHTIDSPATAHNILGVASYATKSPAGLPPANVGQLSFFSSHGPTRDGRPGVDIAAPGEWIASSLSLHCHIPLNCTNAEYFADSNHVYLAGTSMAAPHAAGALALLLAQQPTMTITQARRALSDSAVQDGFTGPNPDRTTWGAGKLHLGPGVIAMTPSQGGLAGGLVDLVGVDFQSGMVVKLNGNTLTPTLIGPNHISVTVPAATQPGTATFTFTNPDTSAGKDFYTYLAPGPLHPVDPARVADTRSGSGKQGAGQTLGANSSLTITVTGSFGPVTVPAGASAAVMNLAVTNTTTGGNLVIWPTGGPQPLVSNINWAAGQTVSNLTEVPLSSSGQVTLFNNGSGSVDVVLDVNGYYTFTTGSGDALHSLAPVRLADSRPANGDPNPVPYHDRTIGPLGQLTIQVDGATLQGNVPSGIAATGVDAVVLELTATNTTNGSNLVVFPGCAGPSNPPPLASNLNFAAGQTLANRAIVKVGTLACSGSQTAQGYVTIFNNSSTATTDLVVDTGGWFQALSGTSGLFVPIAPSRLLDTRPFVHQGAFYTMGPRVTQKVQIAGQAGVPDMSALTPPTAVVLHLTAVFPTRGGFLISYPTGGEPNSADLNFAGGDVVGNLVLVKLNSDGSIRLTNDSLGYTDVVIDVEGCTLAHEEATGKSLAQDEFADQPGEQQRCREWRKEASPQAVAQRVEDRERGQHKAVDLVPCAH